MVSWVKNKFGRGAVPWFFMCAAMVFTLAGVAGTVFFAVSGIALGLNISIPATILGVVGTLVTGFVLDDADYL